MKIYGHPWSINTRKVLMAFAEKGREAKLSFVALPKGEHKKPEYLAKHPFGKVPALEDEDFVLYESGAINRYVDRRVDGPALTPAEDRAAARMAQWIGVSDSYFAPHAGPVIFETLFRRYLGGEKDVRAVETGRDGMRGALDAVDRWLGASEYLAGGSFSLADIHWMPYLEYLTRIGFSEEVSGRPHLSAWWARVSSRPTWQGVARTGPQPEEAGMTPDVIEKMYR